MVKVACVVGEGGVRLVRVGMIGDGGVCDW